MGKSSVRVFGQRLVNRVRREVRKVIPSDPLKGIPRSLQKGAPYLTLVIPAYNVEDYLDDLLNSIFEQSIEFSNFEIIIVDDGSTDGTPGIIEKWIESHPEHIITVRQDNAGAAAARNTGLSKAKGTWVFIPDADDYLDPDYFLHMLKETAALPNEQLLAVISNFKFYHELTDEVVDNHPLRFRFRKGLQRVSTSKMGDFMVFSGATIWLHRHTVESLGIKIDSKVTPTFEDGHFLNRLFLNAPERTISFVPQAVYFYRRRSDQTSLVNSSQTDPNFYTSQIRYGYIGLMREAKALCGEVPDFIQRTCLYDIFLRFKHLVDHPEHAAFLSPEQRNEFLELLDELFTYIDTRVIEEFRLAGLTEEHKSALIANYKNAERELALVYLLQLDRVAGMAEFAYYTGGTQTANVQAFLNDREVSALHSSRRQAKFLGREHFSENRFWISFRDGDQVRFTVNGATARIKRKDKKLGELLSWLDARLILEPAPVTEVPEEVQATRQHVIASRRMYFDCLVFMDSPFRADDNAEHLYRYVMGTPLFDRSYFILDQESKDWPRLEAEGFKLIPYGSDEHIAAQMNADLLISSHADRAILWPIPAKFVEDLVRYRVVFLQHGVIMNDLSRIFNRKTLRLFLTSTKNEYEFVSASDGPFVLSDREVVLTGLPRHDALLEKGQRAEADSILIMPSWRNYLVGPERDGQVDPQFVDKFLESEYYRQWQSVLSSDTLRDIAVRYGKKLIFAPHPNFAAYFEHWFRADYLEIVNVSDQVGYQDLVSKASAAITDYSSICFDLAYLDRPVIYFQFDKEDVFGGNHTFRAGYFSYDRDGFGPVVEANEDVFGKLDEALGGREPKVYGERRKEVFAFRDGQCCERTLEEIEKVLR